MIDKIAAAKTSVIAMPRRGSDKLDEVIEFGVGDLAKTIEPVKKPANLYRRRGHRPMRRQQKTSA